MQTVKMNKRFRAVAASQSGPPDRTTVSIVLGALIILLTPVGSAVRAQAGGADRDVLMALYASTGGANWADNTNWGSSLPLNEWFGVSADEQGHVTHLFLDRNNLVGSIPPELGGLTSLEQLDLYENELTGGIPPELGDLPNLKWLFLHTTSLGGSIPPELGNLSNLKSLQLQANKLTGVIPPELGNLSSLEELGLYDNELTGGIPAWLGDLARLEYLYLHTTDLGGTIPAELGNLSNLKSLQLSDNKLTGGIPPELGSLVNLEELGLHQNELTGGIPPELGDLAKLKYLYLHTTKLTGSIPPELGQLSNLEEFELYGNRLTGGIPPELGDLANLKWIFLHTTNLGGTIPPELGKLSNLKFLQLQANKLTGGVPVELGQLSKLEELGLYENELTGGIPPELGDLASLKWLYLHNTNLTGRIPAELGNLANLVHLDFSENELAGGVPLEFGSLAKLEELFLGGNDLCLPASLVAWYRGLRETDGIPGCGPAGTGLAFSNAIAGQVWVVNESVSLELPEAEGGDGELTYDLTPELPPGLAFDAGTRLILGTPVAATEPMAFEYTATDGDAEEPESATLTFSINVIAQSAAEVGARSVGDDSVEVAWRGQWSAPGRGRLTIEARSPTMDWTTVGTVDPSSGEFVVRGLAPETPYTFRLRFGSSGSAASRSASARSGAEYSDEFSVTTGSYAGPCRTGDRYLCLRDGRFELRADWTNPDRAGDFGFGTATPVDVSDESGLFWFFEPANVELVAKVLDGSRLNGYYWMFFGALSDVEYWLTLRDTAAGGSRRTYHNPPKEICGQSDVRALPGDVAAALGLSSPSAGAHSGRGRWLDAAPLAAAPLPSSWLGQPSESAGACESSEERLCLLESRFSVEVTFIDPNVSDPEADAEGGAAVLPSLTTDNTGFFWFFNRENVELAVKVLDGRAINGNFWLLYGALSDVEYEITVTDTSTGGSKTYRNEAGSICGEIDTGAF